MKLAATRNVAHVCNLIGVYGSTRNAKPTANYIPHSCSVCNVIGAHHSTRNAPQGCNLIGRYIYITFQSSLFILKQIRVCLRPAYIFAGLGCRAWCSSLVTFCLFVCVLNARRGGRCPGWHGCGPAYCALNDDPISSSQRGCDGCHASHRQPPANAVIY